MTAAEIIEEFRQLPSDERGRVADFVREFQTARQLSGNDLGKLAKRMVEAKSPKEAVALKQELEAGFYGD